MKKILLRGLMLLLIAVMCCQLVACGGDEDNGGETTPPTTNPPVQTPAPAVVYEAMLAEGGQTTYTVVYPAGTTETDPIYTALSALVKAFNQKLSAKLSFTTDDAAPVENEILLGDTNRAETAAAKEKLKIGEAIYCLTGTKLVLVGSNDEATLTIVDEFIDDVIGKATNKTLYFTSKNDYHKTKLYTLATVAIDGTPLSDFVVVVPELNSTEHYIARAFIRYIGIHNGTPLEIVDDDTEAAAHEIRIGMTNRTTTTIGANQYAVVAKDGHLEVAFSGLFGAGAMANKLTEEYFNRTYWNADVKMIDNGATIYIANKDDAGTDADITFPAVRTYEAAVGVTKAAGDRRIMFHNVYGYKNLENPNPSAPRTPLYIEIYEEYQPDIVGLQEAGQDWPTDSAAVLEWFEANGYTKICYPDKGGLGNPIFYKSSEFTVVNSGYERRDGGGDKGITWAIFKDVDDGTVFAVTNCHFTADSNANDDRVLGEEYRTADAECLLRVKASIHASVKDCPIISGGDYNTKIDREVEKTDDEGNLLATYTPYQDLIGGGYTNVRDLVANAANVTDISPYNSGSFTYFEEYDIFNFMQAKKAETIEAIDHVLYAGAASACTISQYRVINDTITCTASDHLPHFVDVSWN